MIMSLVLNVVAIVGSFRFRLIRFRLGGFVVVSCGPRDFLGSCLVRGFRGSCLSSMGYQID